MVIHYRVRNDSCPTMFIMKIDTFLKNLREYWPCLSARRALVWFAAYLSLWLYRIFWLLMSRRPWRAFASIRTVAGCFPLRRERAPRSLPSSDHGQLANQCAAPFRNRAFLFIGANPDFWSIRTLLRFCFCAMVIRRSGKYAGQGVSTLADGVHAQVLLGNYAEDPPEIVTILDGLRERVGYTCTRPAASGPCNWSDSGARAKIVYAPGCEDAECQSTGGFAEALEVGVLNEPAGY
jgi:hypothetical protein